MTDKVQTVRAALQEARSGLENLLSNEEMLGKVVKAADLMVASMQQGGKVMSCGNGGSLCDAMHFAEELSGRFRQDRPAYAAMSLADPSHMSCVSNDYGYEDAFSRFVEGIGREGDVLLGITTSGTSKNVVKAAQAAKAKGIKVVALTGKPNTPICELADVAIITPAGRFADRVQELHIKVIHILIELIEAGMAEPNPSKE